MLMVFRFRVLSDENDHFVREYEVSYDMTLLDFHYFICRDLKFGDHAMSSFFLSDKFWNRKAEFTLFDTEENDPLAPQAMDKVLLGQVVHNEHERLIYIFDQLNERALFLELVATKKAENGVKYPRVTLSEGEAPNPEGGVPEIGGSIFDEAMDEFNDFEGDDSYDDE